MSRGKMIVIEGIDGSGKSTQAKMLNGALVNDGYKIHLTRECSNGPIGKLLRDQYLSGKRGTDERVINMLYAADRFDHIMNKDDGMLLYLNEGYNIICDRYYLSSMAYDTYAHVHDIDYNKYLEDIVMRNKINMEALTPDIVIYIDTAPEVAMKRLDDRNETGKYAEAKTVYEEIDKLKDISIAYDFAIRYLQCNREENIVRVNGNVSMEDVFKEIKDNVYPLLKS